MPTRPLWPRHSDQARSVSTTRSPRPPHTTTGSQPLATVHPSHIDLILLRSWMRQNIFSNSPLRICLTMPYHRSATPGATASSTGCRHRVARAPEIRGHVEPFLMPLLGLAQPPMPSPSLESWRQSAPSCRVPHWCSLTPTPRLGRWHLLEHLPTPEHLLEPSTSVLRLSCGIPSVSLFDRCTLPSRSHPVELPSPPLPKTVSPPHRLSPRLVSPPPCVTGHRIHAPLSPRHAEHLPSFIQESQARLALGRPKWSPKEQCSLIFFQSSARPTSCSPLEQWHFSFLFPKLNWIQFKRWTS
jgi:hypothetical protein